jgi:NDP-sugar pyrophosphorylase family protein
MNRLRAMVLAAGFGTRLTPLTDERAKPACPVLDRPLIHFPLSRLAALGVREAVVNLHHQPETVRRALEPAPFGLSIQPIVEPEILGTGGGLKNARARLGDADAIALLNGDTILDEDLSQLVEAHRRGGALATLLLLDDPRAARYGAVEVDAGGAIVRFGGRGDRAGERRGLFAGAHILSPAIFDAMPDESVFCLVRQVYEPLLAARPGAVRGWFGRGRFFDLGTPADYLDAQWSLLERVTPFEFLIAGLEQRESGVWASPTARVARDVSLRAPVLIGAGATVAAGAVIGPRAVIGSGANVAAGSTLSDGVVWDGATAVGRHTHAVVTPNLTVSV